MDYIVIICYRICMENKDQRNLSRMKGSGKGEAKSNNYRKQLRKVNKIHKPS